MEEKAGLQSRTQRWPRGQRGEVWQLTVMEPIPTQAPWKRVSLSRGRPRSSQMTWPQAEADTERIVSHSAVMWYTSFTDRIFREQCHRSRISGPELSSMWFCVVLGDLIVMESYGQVYLSWKFLHIFVTEGRLSFYTFWSQRQVLLTVACIYLYSPFNEAWDTWATSGITRLMNQIFSTGRFY